MHLPNFGRKLCLVVLMFATCFMQDKVDGFFVGHSTPAWQSQVKRAGCALSSSTMMRVGLANNRGMDPYKVLGLKPGTHDRRTIKSRFRSLVLLLHPDTCSEEQQEGNK
jgi:hypothetical protein